MIELPKPDRVGTVPLETVLRERRSRREFAPVPLEAAVLGQILWAGQGITGRDGRRTAPAAGNLGALEISVASPHGLHRYDAPRHSLVEVGSRDVRAELAEAARAQDFVREAAVVVVVGAVVERTAVKYGARATRYVHFEAGHAVQNMLLQATALGVDAVPVGSFDDDRVAAVAQMPPDERPLYMVALGRPRA